MKKSIGSLNEINSDAEASLKGIGYQKLRVIERLLLSLKENKRCIFCTIEHIDDVLVVDMGSDDTAYTTEQNKLYQTPFSINSEEIKNSCRIFFDNWQKIEDSENITFVFYTNATIAKEYKVGELKGIKGELPKEPLLQLLVEKKYEQAFPFVLPVLKQYYIEQHKKHSADEYYERLIETYDFDNWVKFFNLVEWNFGAQNESGVRENIRVCVEQLCIEYDTNTKYTEKIITLLLGLLESRILEKDFLNKIIHVSEVKVLFLEYAKEAEIISKLDPMYSKWDEIECKDIRNIRDKVISVCPHYSINSFEQMEDDYVDGIFEQSQNADIREVKAYNYRIYKICRRIIRNYITPATQSFSDTEIDCIIEEMTAEAEKTILDKSKTYKIPFLDRDMVHKTVIYLFQECYLSFDKEAEIVG